MSTAAVQTKQSFGARGEGETNLSHLRRRLAWACAAELVPMSADVRTQMPQEEREKRMLDELDRVINRIKEARWEYAKAEEVFATNLPAIQIMQFSCTRCGNRNPDLIYADPRTGDTICRGIRGDDNCGEVIQDHRVDRGAAKRNFEDSGDRNHHGPVSNPLMPDSVNLRTQFDGRVDRGAGGKNGDKLAKIANEVEMGISNLGHDQRSSTRTGYKAKQKNTAFGIMKDWSIALQIHEAVIEAAKVEFAKFREVRERIEKFEAVVAGCILLSYEELEGSMVLEKKVFNEMKNRDGLTGTKSSYDVGSRVADAKAKGSSSPNDAAVSCLADHRMSTWTLEQAQEWLQAIATAIGHATDMAIGTEATAAIAVFVAAMKRDLEKAQLAQTKVVKEKPKVSSLPLSLFNSTTIKGRASNATIARSAGKSSTSNKLPTGGQLLISLRNSFLHLLRENQKSTAHDEVVARYFHDAINSRVKFEEWQRKQTSLAEMEANRIKVEEAMTTKGAAMGSKVVELSISTEADQRQREQKQREKEEKEKEKEKEQPTKTAAVQVKVEAGEEAGESPAAQGGDGKEGQGQEEEEDLAALLGFVPSSSSSSFDTTSSGTGSGSNAVKRKAGTAVGAEGSASVSASATIVENKRVKTEPQQPAFQFKIV